MSTAPTNDNWQIEVAGSVYQASLEELPSWIADGSLQPADKVRKGNLRWIEASKVPVMAPLFEAKARGSLVPAIAGIRDIASAHGLMTIDISKPGSEIRLPEGP